MKKETDDHTIIIPEDIESQNIHKRSWSTEQENSHDARIPPFDLEFTEVWWVRKVPRTPIHSNSALRDSRVRENAATREGYGDQGPTTSIP